MKHGKKQYLRLIARRGLYLETEDNELARKGGIKKPGSMNRHKTMSIKQHRTRGRKKG